MELEETFEVIREKYSYKRGFYKGFNLNKVAEDLEGIYILYDEDDVPLYIGESSRMNGRLKAHISKFNAFNSTNIKKIEILPFVGNTTRKERSLVERMFINLLNPQYNKSNKRRDNFNPRFYINHSDKSMFLDYLTIDEMKEL